MKKVLLFILTILVSGVSVSAQEVSADRLQKLIFDLHDTRLKTLSVETREQGELLARYREFYTDRIGNEKQESLKDFSVGQLEGLSKPFLQEYKLDVKVNQESIKENEDGITFEAEITSTQITNDSDEDTKEQIVSECTDVITYTVNDTKSLKVSSEIPTYVLEMGNENSSGKSGDSDSNDENFKETNNMNIDWLPYNATIAVNYAYQHWNSPNSSYCDYANISGGDCTNFVSQCMKSAGWTLVKTKPSGTPGLYVLWYYNGCYDKSTSWAGARYFNEFLRLNPGNARVSTKFSFLQIPNNPTSNIPFKNKIATLNKGAILQQGSSSSSYNNIGHSMIVTKTSGTNRYVTYRSIGTGQAKDKLVTDITSGTYLFGYNVNP